MQTATEIKVLDHGYVRLIETWGGGDAGLNEAGIIEAARQSTGGGFVSWEPYADHPKGDAGLLSFLHRNKHATPFEFAGMIIEVQAPIFVFREWHRHRTQSYNEMSARYAPLPDVNYMPSVDRCLIVNAVNKQAGAVKDSSELTHESALTWLAQLQDFYAHAEALYQSGLKRGLPKEVARVCLPVGRYSRMRASTCLRNWLAFLTLRMDTRAQEEIRLYANAVGSIIAEQFPKTWELFNTKA